MMEAMSAFKYGTLLVQLAITQSHLTTIAMLTVYCWCLIYQLVKALKWSIFGSRKSAKRLMYQGLTFYWWATRQIYKIFDRSQKMLPPKLQNKLAQSTLRQAPRHFKVQRWHSINWWLKFQRKRRSYPRLRRVSIYSRSPSPIRRRTSAADNCTFIFYSQPLKQYP